MIRLTPCILNPLTHSRYRRHFLHPSASNPKLTQALPEAEFPVQIFGEGAIRQLLIADLIGESSFDLKLPALQSRLHLLGLTN